MSHLHRHGVGADSTQSEDASLGLSGLGEEWEKAHPLWNAEVLLILQHHQTSAAKKEIPGTQSAQAQQLLTQTLNYVRSLNNYHSQNAVEQAQEMLRGHPALDAWELALLNNLRIDDFEECITLIPTIKTKIDDGRIEKEEMEKILEDLKRYQAAS